MVQLPRRQVLAAAGLGLLSLAACDHRSSPAPAGWADGIPDWPGRISPLDQGYGSGKCLLPPLPAQLRVSPDGTRVLKFHPRSTDSPSVGLRIWEVATGAPIDPQHDWAHRNHSLCWLPDNTLLIDVGAAVVHVDLAGHTFRHFATGHEYLEPDCGDVLGIAAIDYCPAKNLVVTGGYDGTVRLFDFKDAKALAKTSFETVTWEPRFLGEYILAGDSSSVQVLDTSGSAVKNLPYRLHAAQLGGDRAAFEDEDDLVVLDASLTETHRLNVGSLSAAETLTPSADTLVHTVYTVGADPTTIIVDIKAGQKRELPKLNEMDHYNSFATVTSDGKLLATTYSGVAELDPSTGAIKREFANQ